MTSHGALGEFKTGPLYFFDQPTGRRRIKGTRSNILHFSVPEEGAQLEDTSNQDNDKDDELTERLTGETNGDGTPDTSPDIKDHSPTDAYKRAAPQLLNELAGLLSQNKWIVERYIPHGIVNILNYSWQDLTAGAKHSKGPDQTYKDQSRGSAQLDDTNPQLSAIDKKETERTNPCVVGNSERKPQVSSNARMKKRKQNSKIAAQNSTMVSFSILSNNCRSSGWIIEPKQPSCDEPQQISLCQWVVERLHAARNPEKVQKAEKNQDKPLLLRHYGGAKPKDRRAKRKTQPSTLVNGIPQIPEVMQQNAAQQKLHYRINDGSSFIYYPSGCMAVCQSHSGLPCEGFYTNVFSDSQCPAFLATITASGHGTVTHPLSSTIAAVWDQDGGFMCDHSGNITKQWRWKTDHTLRGKIVIQLSDLISVRLFNGTSAMLSFRCNNESVQLPLSALSNVKQSQEMACLQTDAKFTSDAAQNLLLARKTESPAVSLESKRNLTLTPTI
ncbi:uncharacterized protein LOC113165701 [Anabas testudineus]|uniref:uncharacterized protein LOC113165701 n=1 Tax=Anabas testudineus TaxID=64144 RepID=UPI000E457F65|nr:uncharacterized protein LOC113165701 [Anabas testudineus]